MPSKLYKLTVRKGPQAGQSFSLDADMITLGRDPMADIVITDPEVSRQHARLSRTDAGYQIQDLGSTNGTFLDGRRLTGETVPLQPGQAITMGSNVSLVFEAAVDPMATVISGEADLRFPEPEMEEAEEPIMEEPEMMNEPAAEDMFDMEEEPQIDMDYEATSLDYPAFEAEEEDDNDLFDLPSFDETPAPPSEQATVLDMEAQIPAYEYQGYDEYEDDDALPSFGAEPESTYPPPGAMAGGEQTPPPPPPPAMKEEGRGRNRNLIIAVVAIVLLLCCCCLAVGLYQYGDLIVNELNSF